MSYSVCLLTAACLTAAPPETPAPPPAGTQTIQVTTPDAAPPPASSPKLFGRIRAFFAGRSSEPRDATAGTAPKAQLGMPVSQPAAVTRPAAMPTVRTTPTVRTANGLSEKDLEKAGHEKDYSWITGRVVRTDGSRWVLHYAGPQEVDRYAGSVLLAPKPGMPALRDGDLVCVHGKVSTAAAPRSLAGAVYDATEINVIEHAKR